MLKQSCYQPAILTALIYTQHNTVYKILWCFMTYLTHHICYTKKVNLSDMRLTYLVIVPPKLVFLLFFYNNLQYLNDNYLHKCLSLYIIALVFCTICVQINSNIWVFVNDNSVIHYSLF